MGDNGVRQAVVTGVAGASLLYTSLVHGALTMDLHIGRRRQSLGPFIWHIGAPRDLVFEVIATPYLGRTPRAMQTKLRVIERGADMALAEHYTSTRLLTAVTLETVRFTPPERVDFRLVRGPEPYVVEHFLLRERDGATELEYGGELGTDLWAVGATWGNLVARAWESAVRSSLETIRVEAERRACAGQRRSAPDSLEGSR